MRTRPSRCTASHWATSEGTSPPNSGPTRIPSPRRRSSRSLWVLRRFRPGTSLKRTVRGPRTANRPEAHSSTCRGYRETRCIRRRWYRELQSAGRTRRPRSRTGPTRIESRGCRLFPRGRKRHRALRSAGPGWWKDWSKGSCCCLARYSFRPRSCARHSRDQRCSSFHRPGPARRPDSGPPYRRPSCRWHRRRTGFPPRS